MNVKGRRQNLPDFFERGITMPKYIDADELQELCMKRRYFSIPIDVFKSQPAADVVEVVRCKDCIHYQKATKGFVYGSCDYMHGHIDIDENDFCSLAERRESE